MRVRARITDWDLSRDGAPQFEGVPEGGPFSATAWVRIAPPELLIDPGKDGIVRFNLTVPPEIAPAGYRTGILFEFLPAVGTRRRAKARGPVPQPHRHADLRQRRRAAGQRRADRSLVSASTPERTRVIAVLANTSKRTVRTKGTMTLFEAAGKAVAQVPLPDVPVLPESEREVAIRRLRGRQAAARWRVPRRSEDSTSACRP